MLYTIYTCDMPVVENVEITTYADDTAVVACSTNAIEATTLVQNEIKCFEE